MVTKLVLEIIEEAQKAAKEFPAGSERLLAVCLPDAEF